MFGNSSLQSHKYPMHCSKFKTNVSFDTKIKERVYLWIDYLKDRENIYNNATL